MTRKQKKMLWRIITAAALFVICFIFTVVTKALDLIKRKVLRWQNGVVK